MPEKKISRVSTPSRLFVKDEIHLKRHVKERGSTDTRFKDNSSAVRHYVSIGIATEMRTLAANTLNDRIIKATQKEVVTDSLLPLKNIIDDLIKVMRTFGQKQDEFFIEQEKSTDRILRRIESFNESCEQRFDSIAENFSITGRVNNEALRNSIILRSINYVFLLAIKSGRIEQGEILPWEKLVGFAHRKAKELTDREIEAIIDNEYEVRVVEDLAKEMFTEIKNFQRASSSSALPKLRKRE